MHKYIFYLQSRFLVIDTVVEHCNYIQGEIKKVKEKIQDLYLLLKQNFEKVEQYRTSFILKN